MNSNTLKGFFRKPIAAVTAVVLFLTVLTKFIFGFSGIYRPELLNTFEDGSLGYILLNELPKYNINVFALFLAIVFLTLFVASRKDGNLQKTAAVFKTGSIIGLVLIIIAVVLFIAMLTFFVFVALLGIGFFMIRFLPAAIFSAPIIAAVFTIAVVLSVLLVLISAAQLSFAVSVKRSAEDGKPRRGTAMFFAVMNFVSAAVMFFAVFLVMFFDRDNAGTALTVNILVSVPSYVFVGITAVNFSKYIHLT